MESTPSYTVAADIGQARTLPADFYRDLGVYQVLLKRAFSHSWQFVGHKNDLPNARWKPITLLPGSLDLPLVLGTGEKRHRLWSNICTHRGHELTTVPSNRPMLRCRYHGRAFDANGMVVDAPGFEDVPGFPCPSDQLPEVPLTAWQGLLFGHPANGTQEGDTTWLEPILARLPKGVVGSWLPAPD